MTAWLTPDELIGTLVARRREVYKEGCGRGTDVKHTRTDEVLQSG